MFKAFLSFALFFAAASGVCAQAPTAFKESEGEQENTLSKYINASSVCAKMTDPEALYERGMLLISDANSDAFMAAADCFTSAAMRNHTPSQLELGKLYEMGNGVSQSKIFAYKWYQTAVLLGNQDAIPYRNKLETNMSLDEISLANPMIQSTLKLIDLFDQKQQDEVDKLDMKVAKEYKDFGVDIAKYDIKEEKKNTVENPLIEALIRDQQKKMKAASLKNKAKNAKTEQTAFPFAGGAPDGENDDEGFARRRRRRIEQEEPAEQKEDWRNFGDDASPAAPDSGGDANF